MNIQLLTKDDLAEFKEELLKEFAKILASGAPVSPANTPWLRSYQVKAMLKISYGTLQTLRSNGTLPARKIGGLMYYNIKDIETAMNRDRPVTTHRDFTRNKK